MHRYGIGLDGAVAEHGPSTPQLARMALPSTVELIAPLETLPEPSRLTRFSIAADRAVTQIGAAWG